MALAYQRVFVGEIAMIQRKTRCCSPETSYFMDSLPPIIHRKVDQTRCWIVGSILITTGHVLSPGAAKDARIMARRRTQDHRTWDWR